MYRQIIAEWSRRKAVTSMVVRWFNKRWQHAWGKEKSHYNKLARLKRDAGWKVETKKKMSWQN